MIDTFLLSNDNFSPKLGILMLNYEDTLKITPFIDNPELITDAPVATNLRFTYCDYYKYLSSLQKFYEVSTIEQVSSLLQSVLDGNIISSIDIENLFLRDLGVKLGRKKVLNDFELQFAKIVNYAFQDYYSIEDDDVPWIDMVGWTIAGEDICYPFNRIISSGMFQNFALNVTENGNVLTYNRK